MSENRYRTVIKNMSRELKFRCKVYGFFYFIKLKKKRALYVLLYKILQNEILRFLKPMR
jgi:hypothetical protein